MEYKNNELSEEEFMDVKKGFQHIEGDNFLENNKTLSDLNLPNLRSVDDKFLSDNIQLSELNLELEQEEEKSSGRRR